MEDLVRIEALRFLRGRSIRDLVWLLASVPVLLGPPLAAIAIIAFQFWRTPKTTALAVWRWPLSLALINVLLSLAFWRYAASQVIKWGAEILFWLNSLLFLNGIEIPSVKIIPVLF